MIENAEFKKIVDIVDGILDLKKSCDIVAERCDTFDEARKLAVKYWSMVSTVNECIFRVGKIQVTMEIDNKLLYSKLIAECPETSDAAKKRYADNNNQYINAKGSLENIELYLSYLKDIREDIDKGHYLMKSMYENSIVVMQNTPKIN